MKITKKIMSVILAAIMVIGALAVSVSADSIYDTAVDLPSGEKQTFTLSDYQQKDYKVKLSKSGTLTININARIEWSGLWLYDEDGNKIVPSEYDFTTGKGSSNSERLFCEWNSTTENFKCTAKYELKKGTYYIRYERNNWKGGSGKTTFTATYPSKDSEEEISGSTGKISYLTLEMEVGDTIRLGTLTEPADADVTWSSSKSSIATVSASGKVTAKKEGSAIIKAKCGSSVKNIKIIVV
ncbi:MAG: hypothetical protein HDT25_08685 [Ruminococcus sp.]|nr:hypothetical protein [Ruminococcus sp.]